MRKLSSLDQAKELLDEVPDVHTVDDTTIGIALVAIGWGLVAAVETMRELVTTLRKK